MRVKTNLIERFVAHKQVTVQIQNPVIAVAQVEAVADEGTGEI